MKKILIVLFIFLSTLANAKIKEIKPTINSKTSFGIFIDNDSYNFTKDEVIAYKNVLESEGLGTYIFVVEDSSPMEIRSKILKYSNIKMPLEGIVLIGDIPIPMLRDAQHLSSAFKMKQTADWKISSIPSDRYYDDFSLKFNFIKQDEDNPLYFYFSLDPSSEQQIHSNIYSARIKPIVIKGVDKNVLLARYLTKVVRLHKESSSINNMFVFCGHGYNSESLDSWEGEQWALREQLPSLFTNGNRVRFSNFNTKFPMKPYILQQIQDTTMDIALFHHHGADDTQYINGYEDISDVDGSIENIKRYLRSKVVDKKDSLERIDYFMKKYDINRSWFDLSDSTKVSDSLYDASLDIYSSDIDQIRTYPKFVMFDACYNGSFYMDHYIAGSYIFNEGNTVVTLGNTVNSLQDKWPDELIGLLAHGVRVGVWAKNVNYLETHLIGDPTYRFANEYGDNLAEKINDNFISGSNKKAINKYWLRNLSSNKCVEGSADVLSISLRMLFNNYYEGIEDLLVNTFKVSNFFAVRMECLNLLAKINGEGLREVLPLALEDNYELIRRFGIEYISRCGDEGFIPYLVKAINREILSNRFSYYSKSVIKVFPSEKILPVLEDVFANNNLAPDYSSYSLYLSNIKRYKRSTAEDIKLIFDKGAKSKYRMMNIRAFRNYHCHYAVPDLIRFATDKSQDFDLRMAMIEALGWFDMSFRHQEIIDACKNIITIDDNPSIQKECKMTISRLKPAY